MINYIIKRLIYAIPGLLGIILITFILTRILPGDPAVMIAGEQAPPQTIEKIRVEMGLNDPLYIQFINYVKKVAEGDLGTAWHTGHPVLSDFATRFPATLELTLVAMFIAIIIAIPVGVISATRKNSWMDHLSRIFSLLGAAVPIFWLGLVLIYILYARLGWVPAPLGRISMDIHPPTQITGLFILDSLLTGDMIALKQSISQILLPAVCLSMVTMAVVARMTRSSMLEVIGLDYVRTARAKGLTERVVIYKHALANALIPTLTVLGLQFGYLLGNAVITETIFAWPGIGSYITESILATDYAPIQAFTLASAAVYLFINLSVDLLYGLIDPRIRYD